MRPLNGTESDGSSINNDYIPRLRINPAYKQMIAKGRLTKKEKEYIQERMRSGKFLMSSIEQRQQTIERIAGEILKFQNDFLRRSLRAKAINHESSRRDD